MAFTSRVRVIGPSLGGTDVRRSRRTSPQRMRRCAREARPSAPRRASRRRRRSLRRAALRGALHALLRLRAPRQRQRRRRYRRSHRRSSRLGPAIEPMAAPAIVPVAATIVSVGLVILWLPAFELIPHAVGRCTHHAIADAMQSLHARAALLDGRRDALA